MNDTAVVDQTTQTSNATQPEIDLDRIEIRKMLGFAVELCGNLELIEDLREKKMFRFLSKNQRNQLINNVVELTECLFDSAKRTRQLIKKDKRQRTPDEIIDLLLMKNRASAESLSSIYGAQPEVGDADED